ncbi:hypothetical protein PENTCL1PPCAC_25473 [Pristionchus entomophagus]|uniref:BTB domain-containing protein n=1 Tax=Pristionchus entomophagus TaxID=358040 RepID=A0AAV5UA74_9BILA|nr:hypothetical protein PENTCL1PPCAC_25473 [Pristionchus entomophagus]
MPLPLVIASHSSRMFVHLKSDECTMDISKDLTSLVFESKSEKPLKSVKIQLKDENGSEVISLVSHFHGGGRCESIRVDAIYPLIFGINELFDLVPEMMLSWLGEKGGNVKTYQMTVQLSDLKPCPISSSTHDTARVYTAMLIVDSAAIPVSKELLAVRSPFFETIFYREFHEKRKGVYEIKEVDLVNFRRFIEYLHERDRAIKQISSVEMAISALSYADRFGFTDIHEQAFAFLMDQTLPKEALKEMFTVCSRFSESDFMIEWILGQYESDQELIDLIHDSVPFVSASIIQSALKALQSVVKNLKVKCMQSVLKDIYQDHKAVLIHLKCYNINDENSVMEDERFFTVNLDSAKDFNYSNLWPKIPTGYSSVQIGDVTKKRGHTGYYKVGDSTLVIVDAYRTDNVGK